nr:lymphocyte antigen 6E-like [Pogona vitticeps]
MKTLLVASLLGAVLCGETVLSLQCYKCEDQSSNSNSIESVKCAETDKFCVSTIITVGKGENAERQFTKGCSPNCTEREVDTGVATVTSKCCTFSFCNK